MAAVDATALQDLARGVTDLRDRSLAEAFDTKDVTRVTIQRPSVTLSLDRTGTGEEDWQLAAPKKGKTRGGRVSELLWTLRNLKWKDLVAEQGWDPARYGLDAGATTVTLAGKDGQTIAALAVGKQEAGRHVRPDPRPAGPLRDRLEDARRPARHARGAAPLGRAPARAATPSARSRRRR